uniref:Uncharacterized protein n=1 Tax=Clastoptera arizonana TaxID=38151 RepID=A0A1B6EA91_9HEMI
MEMSFKNKIVLVTGGGNGIGREICKTLYKYGAKVVTVCLDGPALLSLAKECPGIKTIELDVAKDWNKTHETILGIGHVDALVNNAGVGITAPFVDVTPESFDKYE